MTRLAVKGEGSPARLRTGADDGPTGLTVETTRLRLLLEGSHEHALEGGATLTPALEAGVRHDGGDAAEGAGLEAGASVTWHDPAEGLTAELRARLLAAHETDRDEWGVRTTAPKGVPVELPDRSTRRAMQAVVPSAFSPSGA